MNTYNEQERHAFALGQAVGLGFTQPLGRMRRGGVGRILAVSSAAGDRDIERGLLEMGFVEGARVEVLHHGFLGQDPLAVRINQTMTVALRRCEANAVLIGPLHDSATDIHPAMTLEYASS
ncbi:MAG: FeoA family protein [Candidatus Competibacter sp.]|nr:FeoA family protein [Candidatus Competibacter sp.]MDG4584483.1 FeoA family protein [Candidatus Competibacter sp.]